jgi:hypothetical protein
VIGTGKTTKPSITVGNTDLVGYELYQNNEHDLTYMRDWSQHSDKTISLLKAKKQLNFYP